MLGTQSREVSALFGFISVQIQETNDVELRVDFFIPIDGRNKGCHDGGGSVTGCRSDKMVGAITITWTCCIR